MLFCCCACGTDRDRPPRFDPLPPGPLTVTTRDGTPIAGMVTGRVPRAVILASMSTTDQTSWEPFLAAARGLPVTLVTYDRRGVGRSGGTADPSFPEQQTRLDVDAVYDVIRRHGYPAIGCIGASLGGVACYLVARQPGVTALGILAAPPPSGASLTYLNGLRYPKLFAVGKGDRDLVWTIEHMAASAPGPKRLIELDSDRHGTNLFSTAEGPRLIQALLDLVRQMPTSARMTASPTSARSSA
jgi:pimeloyl-ACP methyl ester carboxylesterase